MNKKRKQLIRESDKIARGKELELLERNKQRLLSQVGGFARQGTVAKPKVKTVHFRQDEIDNARGTKPTTLLIKAKPVPRYNGEMLDRENAALARYEGMKARTGPVFNKGGYQYLGDLDLEEVMSGNTRRR